MSTGQRRAGVVLGYVNIVVKNLVNLVYTPMLLSFVGQADYGVFQSCASFIFSLSLLTFGFSEAYVRFYTIRRNEKSEQSIKVLNGTYLLMYLVITFVILVLGLYFASKAEWFFSSGFTGSQVKLAHALLQLMTFNIALTVFSTVFDAYILANEQFKFQQTRQIATSLATPVIAYTLLKIGMGAIGVAIAQLLITVILLGLNAKYSIIDLGMRFSVCNFDTRLFKTIAAFSAWIFANQICELVNQNVPNILLAALTSASVVAVFAVSVQVRQVFSSLSTTMSNVFIPKINRIVSTTDDNVELTNLMTRVGRYQLILFCWVYGGFVVLGRFFIAEWAGAEFAPAYGLICFMTAPFMIPLCQNTGIEIQRAKNKHKARSIVYLFMALVNIIITFILAPRIGYWAPALGYVVSMIFGPGLFMNWYYKNRIGLDIGYFWRHCLPVVFYGLISVIFILLLELALPVSSWISFLFVGAAYTGIYLLFIWYRVASETERLTISNKFASLR